MRREIKFSLLYRDMWQSSGKYVPRIDQLLKVAPAIIDMGCFSRIETNGGGFEQINLLFGENPNASVRAWTQPFNDAGIQTHMLERALNGIRMNPVPADVRKLMFRVKKKQGTDIARSFCGLNDPRNIIDSISYAKKGGMIAQAAMSLTYSEVHTVEYYINLAEQLIAGGADEICLKDMAGIARPVWLAQITEGIKKSHPDIVIQYHGHAGPGFQVATILEVVNAGAEYVDVGMEPLSWGTGHADLLTVQAMLKDAGYLVPDINMKAYMEVRRLTQEFMDDFLGYYINPKNRLMNSLLIGPGLPGGMMGSLMADLENNLASLNKWMRKHNKPELTQDELLISLFDEVRYIWPKMGFPPLVTPFSQYVKNVALMNVMQMMKGNKRWTMIDDNTWDMMLGKAGKLPGKLDKEIIDLSKEQNREFYEGRPQDLYPDCLDTFRAEMDKNQWEYGEDDEELLELAMHPQQYRNYKSGKAKEEFETDLKAKREATRPTPAPAAPAEVKGTFQPKSLNIDVNGEVYRVKISYDNDVPAVLEGKGEAVQDIKTGSEDQVIEIFAPIEGNFYRTKNPGDKPVRIGDEIKKGSVVAYIESMKVYNAITSDVEGKVLEICFSDGSPVEEDDVIIKVE
jgi:pyruvate carboxylase subunit B